MKMFDNLIASYFLLILNMDLLQVVAAAKIAEGVQFFNISDILIFVLVPGFYFYLCHPS